MATIIMKVYFAEFSWIKWLYFAFILYVLQSGRCRWTLSKYLLVVSFVNIGVVYSLCNKCRLWCIICIIPPNCLLSRYNITILISLYWYLDSENNGNIYSEIYLQNFILPRLWTLALDVMRMIQNWLRKMAWNNIANIYTIFTRFI